MELEQVSFILNKSFHFKRNLKGYRNCSGQYNGGYPCVGATIDYQTCTTNVTCPSKYFNNIF
jgi:hypothetical protein